MKNTIPEVGRPFIDKIAYILPWAESPKKDPAVVMQSIREKVDQAIDRRECEWTYVSGTRYRQNFNVNLPGGHKVLVQIGAKTPEIQHGGIRISFNPSNLDRGDVNVLHGVVRGIVGSRYDGLVDRPSINVLHVATDITGINLNHMYVNYENARKTAVVMKQMVDGDRLESLYFGSVHSDYISTVYDKSIERAHAAARRIAKTGHLNKEEMQSNILRQLQVARAIPETVRVEVRAVKMRGVALPDLCSLTNRFERFTLASFHKYRDDLPKSVVIAFHAELRQNGLKSAREIFEGSKHGRTILGYSQSMESRWWQPEGYWRQGCDSLRRLGIFPESAFYH